MLKPGRLWVMMPVRVSHQAGTIEEEGLDDDAGSGKKKKKKRKGGKKKKQASSYEEVVLESVQGCPWRGELRIGVRHKPAARKGESGV